MKKIIVSQNEAGQRMDKLLAKYLSEAPKSFFYKMLRKKILEEYTERFGPMTADDVRATNEWTWATAPWPWETED